MLQYRRNARLIALVVAALASGSGISAAQTRQSGVGITVFDHVNFEGPSVTLRGDVPDLRNFQFNDRISSLQVPAGESWEVCADINYGGRCIVVSSSDRDLRQYGLSDVVTSLRRVQGRDGRSGRNAVAPPNARGGRDDRDDRGGSVGITVSDDVNFEGATVTVRRDVPDLREVQFNDRVSSLRVAPGDSWEVCENTNYGGRCVLVSGSERDLRRYGLNDTISSMRRAQGREGRSGDRGDRDDRGGVAEVPRSGRDAIVLFDRPGYTGTAQRVTEAAAGLGAFSNRARSAQILDGAWELCEEPRWGGRCVRVSSSVPDLERIGIAGVASVRPIDSRR